MATSASGSTKRKYLAAVQSFATYLVEIDVLAMNPCQGVKAPPQAPPRVVALSLEEVRRIVEAADATYRALFALLYGAGVEIGAALAVTRRDVDGLRREVRAPGTKTRGGPPGLVLRVYGRFAPGTVDRDRWETAAAQAEATRREAVAAANG